MNAEVQFRLRIRRGGEIVIGPGKVALLEAIHSSGSIAAAARTLDMSYRRAWLLIDQMNRGLREPVIAARSGGARGGGALLTATAHDVIHHYRAIDRLAQQAAAAELAALTRLLKD